jgi:hypothetical protein
MRGRLTQGTTCAEPCPIRLGSFEGISILLIGRLVKLENAIVFSAARKNFHGISDSILGGISCVGR